MNGGSEVSHRFGAIWRNGAVRSGCSVDNGPCKNTISLVYYNPLVFGLSSYLSHTASS